MRAELNRAALLAGEAAGSAGSDEERVRAAMMVVRDLPLTENERFECAITGALERVSPAFRRRMMEELRLMAVAIHQRRKPDLSVLKEPVHLVRMWKELMA